MFHPLTIFSADKNWSIAFPDRCGELANKNAMNCHQHSSRQPLFAIFASFWKSRENLVNKANCDISDSFPACMVEPLRGLCACKW